MEVLTPSNVSCECPDCGLFQQIGRLRPGEMAMCERCSALLRRRRRNSLGTTFALSTASFMLMPVASMEPVLGFRFAGQERLTSLFGLPLAFEQADMPLLAIAVFATTVVAPFVRVLCSVVLLGSLVVKGGRLPHAVLVLLARLRELLGPWAMLEVFLLGLFVAYTRLEAKSTVEVGVGLYALGALVVVTAWTDCWMDRHALWEAIGRRRRIVVPQGRRVGRLIGCDCCEKVSRGRVGDACPRCDVPLRERKPQPIVRCWALLLTAAVLYIPANVYPILTLTTLGSGEPSTILGGVVELIEYRMWPLAALVFVASILVPSLKLLALVVLLVSTQRGSDRRLHDRTRLYRIVDIVGRWSMIDVFMLSVLTALVQMGLLAKVVPGLGAVAFASVVLLTMLAAFSFDPRVMWDAAEARQARTGAGLAGSGLPEAAAVQKVQA